jgi:hypothetical protein
MQEMRSKQEMVTLSICPVIQSASSRAQLLLLNERLSENLERDPPTFLRVQPSMATDVWRETETVLLRLTQ